MLPIMLSPTEDTFKSKLRNLYASQEIIPKLIDDERLEEQRLSEFYIKLQLILRENDEGSEQAAAHDRILGEKQEIEVQNIFEALNNDHFKDIGKVLILGGAGVGKTTLLHYLSWKWATNGLWMIKFDLVFRIKLKELLNTGWMNRYSHAILELGKTTLQCFIHHCLASNIELSQIPEIDTDKILLLIDGYDEVVQLSKTNREYKEIMREIAQCKHVIMTSRPNALGNDIQQQLGIQRKIENVGLDFTGMMRYIDLYFKEEKDLTLGEELKAFLDQNRSVKEMCRVPINIVLVCLIWKNEETRENMANITNIGQLYYEVIVWLGKRYLEKFENWDAENTTAENVFCSDEVKYLQKVAFEAFVATGKIVTKEIVKRHLGNLNITKINKFGLLKAEGDGKILINLNHQFVHLTFQEFLTAWRLKEKLGGNGEEAKEACLLIGLHRNEPKYLVTLKFLAGLISTETGERGQSMANRFWEAVTCNVDGILELGLETKVTLLMHLLGQSYIGVVLDTKIPTLNSIQELIDNQVMSFIEKWRVQIIESGYLSNSMAEELKETWEEWISRNSQLNRSEIVEENKLSVAIEVITAFATTNKFGTKEHILNQVIHLIQTTDWKLQNLGLDKLNQILDKTITKNAVLCYLQMLLPLIDLNNYAGDIVIKIVVLHADLNDQVFRYLQNVVDDKNATEKNRATVTRLIIQLIKAMPSKTVNPVQARAFELLTSMLNNLIHSKTYEFESMDTMVELIGTIGPPDEKYDKAVEVLTILDSVLNFDGIDHNLRGTAASSMLKIVQLMSPEIFQHQLGRQAMKLLFEAFSNTNIDPQLKRSIVIIIKELIQNIPENEAITATDKLYNLLLQNLNNDDCPLEAAKGFIAIISVLSPERIREVTSSVFDEWVSFIDNQAFTSDNKNSAIFGIRDILEVMPLDQVSTYRDEALKVFTRIINNRMAENSSNLRSNAAITIVELLNLMTPDEIVREGIRALRTFIDALKIPDQINFVFNVTDCLVKTLELIPPAVSQGLAEAVLDMLIKILEDPTKDEGSTHAALVSVVKLTNRIFSASPTSDFIEKVFSSLVKIILHNTIIDFVKGTALDRIGELIENSQIQGTNIGSRAFDLLYEIICNANSSDFKCSAIDNMTKVLKVMSSERANQVFETMTGLLKNAASTADVKCSIITSYPSIVKCMTPETQATAFDTIFDTLIIAFKNSKPPEKTSSVTMLKDFVTDLRRPVMETVQKFVGELIELRKSTLLLDHDIIEIRNAAKTGLVSKLTNSHKMAEINYTQLMDLFKIISSSQGPEENDRKLRSVTNDALKLIKSNINHEEIKWFNKNFKHFRTTLHKVFLKALLHQVLSSQEEISETISEFVINCIEMGFTTTITMTGTLIFEDVVYTFNTEDPSNKHIYLENIAHAAIQQKNVLAKQYQTYAPMFTNHEFGLTTAAIDVQVFSLTDPKKEIRSDYWELSVMHLSNHLKDEPSKVFALLEKRNPFGYHIVSKIFIEFQKIKSIQRTLHPADISKDLREDIFTKMEYITADTKLTYYGLSCRLALETGEMLIKSAETTRYYDQNATESEYKVIHEFLHDLLKDGPNLGIRFNSTWEEHTASGKLLLFNKDPLLQVKDLESTMRDSKIIDHSEGLAKHKKLLGIVGKKTEAMNLIINDLVSKGDISARDQQAIQGIMRQIQSKIENLKNDPAIQDIIKSMNELMDNEEVTMERLKLLEQDIDELLKKPY